MTKDNFVHIHSLRMFAVYLTSRTAQLHLRSFTSLLHHADVNYTIKNSKNSNTSKYSTVQQMHVVSSLDTVCQNDSQ